MHATARAVFLGVSLAAMITACSKPVSPVVGTSSKEESSAAWSGPRVREPQAARGRVQFVGSSVRLDAAFQTRLDRHVVTLVDVIEQADLQLESPFDTIPANSVFQRIRWRAADGHGWVIEQEPVFANIDPRNADGTLPPGHHIMHLVAPERAGGGGVFLLVLVGYPPEEMWWAGPDPARFPPSSDGDGRAVDVQDWANFTTSPAWPPDGRAYFGPDSFQYVPPRRLPVDGDIERRTFYEIWGDRIYARSEGDVVHQGAWLVFSTGGFDRDSPYVVPVSAGAPTLPPGYESQPDLYPVLIEQGLIGSPVGFRHRVQVRFANGQITQPSESTTHPNFDVFSVLYFPAVASYWPAQFPGKGYATVLPVDSHGQVGRTSEDLAALADRVDSGGGSAADRALRRRVLTFQVAAPGPGSRSPDDLARGQ